MNPLVADGRKKINNTHMKATIRLSIIGCVLLLFSACELSDIDNYPGPNATIHGGIYDMETGELIQQDIIRGMEIEYIEDGFANPEVQYMVVKNDGTYMNRLMFANTYTITPVRGNFVPVGPKGVRIQGDTQIDFHVLPYIRVKNVQIDQQGDKIVASFNLQQTVPQRTSKIGLYVHREENVGEPLNIVSTESIINTVVDEATVYTLEIDLTAHASQLRPGHSYYFRVGALMTAPEAKLNYAPAVRLTL